METTEGKIYANIWTKIEDIKFYFIIIQTKLKRKRKKKKRKLHLGIHPELSFKKPWGEKPSVNQTPRLYDAPLIVDRENAASIGRDVKCTKKWHR